MDDAPAVHFDNEDAVLAALHAFAGVVVNADVADGHRHRRRLTRRELRDRVERVAGLEVDAHAGRRVVIGDALVRECELVLLVEIERHRVVGRVDGRGHRDLQRDRLTRLHVVRQ